MRTPEKFFYFVQKYSGIILSDTVKEKFTKEFVKENGEFTHEAVSALNLNFVYPPLKESSNLNSGKMIDLDDEEIISRIKDNDAITSGADIRKLFKLRHYEEKFNIATQTKNFDNDALPTMVISNLASAFNRSLARDVAGNAKSLFSQNSKLFKRIEILNEIEGSGESMQVANADPITLFKLGTIRNIFSSAINSDEIFIQPFNFSDKSKIIGLSINEKDSYVNFDGNSQEGVDIMKLSSNEIKEDYRRRQEHYYTLLITDVFSDINKLADGKLKGGSLSQKIESLEEYLSKFTRDQLLLKAKEYNEANPNDRVELIDEVHFASYRNSKTLRMNQLIKMNTLLYSNKQLFEKWSSSMERKSGSWVDENMRIPLSDLVVKTKGNNKLSVDKVDNLRDPENSIKDIVAERFNISREDIFNETANDKGKIDYELKLTESDDNGDTTLSEIGKKLMWVKNIVVSQYEHMTVKGTYLHPSTLDVEEKTLTVDPSNVDEMMKRWHTEENSRAVPFTKRMVIAGASQSTFVKGNYGMNTSHKFAIVSDVNKKIFNFSGLSKGQKVYDGGGFVSPFFSNIMIDAMPGWGLNRVQKPIGTSIGKYSNTFLKFATFGLTNELIRNSINSDHDLTNWMKKMHDFSLTEGFSASSQNKTNQILEDGLFNFTNNLGDVET